METIEIEKLFDDFLLYNIGIYHNNKVLRTGKLKMVSMKNHNIKFYIETNMGIKTIELLYPFNYKKTSDLITFEYYVDTLVKDNKELKNMIDVYPTDQASKFLNTEVYFKRI